MDTSKAAPAGRRTAVIVGASSGIGKEVALKLSGRGWRVYNLSRTPLSSERVKTMTADAAREGELRRAILDIGTECGNLDLLVYSAGFSMAAPIEYAAAGDYRYLFEVNYFGAVEAMKAALPFLKKRGGRMILIGSRGGRIARSLRHILFLLQGGARNACARGGHGTSSRGRAGERDPAPVVAAGGRNAFLRASGRVLPERVTDWLVRKKFRQP